jgi:inorganic pyrophosphatase
VTLELPAHVLVEIEVPRWSFLKHQSGKGLEYVSPLPCPYNYGFVPDTRAEDGEAQDAIVLGRRLPRGTRIDVQVLGRVLFLDAGVSDDKWICGKAPLSRFDHSSLRAFFTGYVRVRSLLNLLRGERRPTKYLGLQLSSR